MRAEVDVRGARNTLIERFLDSIEDGRLQALSDLLMTCVIYSRARFTDVPAFIVITSFLQTDRWGVERSQ